MDIAVKLIFDLLAFTSVMVLIVLGLGVIASMMGIFNFAHGEFVLLGAYTLFLFQEGGLPSWMGILAAPIVVACVGLVLERLVIRRFYAAPIIAMLGTFALGLVIREIVRGLLGGHYKLSSSPAGCSCRERGSACRSAAPWRIPRSPAAAASRPSACTRLPLRSGLRSPAWPVH
jgi:branched-chain amino acid transport system permease protein